MNNVKITITANVVPANALFAKIAKTEMSQLLSGSVGVAQKQRTYSALQTALKNKAGYSSKQMNVLLDAIDLYSVSSPPNLIDCYYSDLQILERLIDQGKSFEEIVQFFLGN